MALQDLANGVDSPQNIVSGGPERRVEARTEGNLTKIRLRAALAREEALLRQIDRLIQEQHDVLSSLFGWRKDAVSRVARLTPREREIMEMILAGHLNKNIAVDLGISQRTVESHRASIMRKTGSKSLPALARLALAAGGNGSSNQFHAER